MDKVQSTLAADHEERQQNFSRWQREQADKRKAEEEPNTAWLTLAQAAEKLGLVSHKTGVPTRAAFTTRSVATGRSASAPA